MEFFWCTTWLVILGGISAIMATLQVVEQPKNATIEEGQPLVLSCKLNEPANCTWNRNDVLTTISERYRFVTNNGMNTKDCSFEILNAKADFDAAAWQCFAQQGSSQPVYSDKVVLDVQSPMYPTHAHVRIVEQPQNASVAYGRNHTITCKFNEPVDCVWTRSKSAMEIKGRYRYLSNNGTNTKDCSFSITNFTHPDATYWQCSAMHKPGRIYTKEAVSDMIFLSIDDVPPTPLEIVVQPSNETVDPGQIHTLICKFNAPVNCVWERNGTETTIDGRYHYIRNNGTRTPDCSIYISSFSAKFDAMVWQCKALDTINNRLVVSDKVFLEAQNSSPVPQNYLEGSRHIPRALPHAASTIPVILQPQNASVILEHDHLLSCVFNSPVNCAWRIDGIPVEIDGNRYQYSSIDGGKNTVNCSFLLTHFNERDVGNWECLGTIPNDDTHHGHSDMAYLSILDVVHPNRTAILINGTQVTEIWVPKDGKQNGTLECVAEFAVPAAKLYWSNNGRNISEGSAVTKEDCFESCYCNSTLSWFGDWKQLVNLTTLTCNIVHIDSFHDVTAILKFRSEPKVSSSSLSPGAIAGIIIAVLLVVLIIVGAVVYYLVIKPRGRKNLPPVNITIAPTKNYDDENVVKIALPSPSASDKSKANSTPGHSAETVRMNDRKPEAAHQSPAHVPLVKNVQGESKPNNNAEDSSDSDGEKQKPGINSRYSSPFTYIGGKDIFPVKKN